jgi:hypothetical protein
MTTDAHRLASSLSSRLALIELDCKRTPQDKIDSIMECKTSIEHVIRTSAANSTTLTINADCFLPALIYVVLRAKPPRLHSNMEFLSRFSQPNGEQLYYLATLVRQRNTNEHRAECDRFSSRIRLFVSSNLFKPIIWACRRRTSVCICAASLSNHQLSASISTILWKRNVNFNRHAKCHFSIDKSINIGRNCTTIYASFIVV